MLIASKDVGSKADESGCIASETEAAAPKADESGCIASEAAAVNADSKQLPRGNRSSVAKSQ
jgi:hypothetical protein